MINIYLVRHAQSTGNIEKRLTGRKDYELTLEGKKQVEQLTEELKKIKFNGIYSSPYKRTVDTVQQLAEINDLTVNKEDELSEMFFGIYDGFKWKDVNKINPQIHRDHILTNEIIGIEKQETTEKVQERMYNKITQIVSSYKEANILISSHGVAIEAFLRKITKVPFLEDIEEYSQKNTSINIIQYNCENKEYKVKVLNSKNI